MSIITDQYIKSYEEETPEEEEEQQAPAPIKMRSTGGRPIVMNVSDTQYPIVKYVGNVIMEWKLQYEPDCVDWDVWWTDLAVQPETLAKMKCNDES